MTDTTRPIATLAEHTAQRFDEAIEHTAQRFEYVAEEIRRLKSPGPPVLGVGSALLRDAPGAPEPTPDFVRAASRVIHAAHWGLANAHVDGIMTAAAEADRAAREERT